MSTALEAASLIMVPSGYEDGSLASVKPTDGTGDFTFSRGSDISATRVNEDGYIEKGYENLLLQSNSFDTTWTNNNSTETGGQTGYDGSSDAWLLTSLSGYASIQQIINVSGVFTISLYLKSGSNGGVLLQVIGINNSLVRFNLDDGTLISKASAVISADIESVGNGWYRASYSLSGSITTFRIYPADNTGDQGIAGSIYIQDAMLNQGMVSYPYVETTTAPVAGGILEDEPRLDYSGSCPALLLEPQRTNLLRNSEALNISPNVVESVSYSYNEIASPSGFINAPKFSETPDGTLYRHGFYHYVSIPNGAITASIFTKQIDRRYVSFQSNATGSNQYSYVDLEDGSVVSEGTGWTLSTEDYGNGWWRIIATATGIQGSPYFIWGMSLNGTSNTYSGNGSEFTFWGGQIEEASYPTSYIPTYGTSQTRLAEDLELPTLSSVFDSTGSFTLFFEIERLSSSVQQQILYIRGQGYFRLDATADNRLKFVIYGGGASVTEANSDINTFVAGTSSKIIYKQNGTIGQCFINGQEISSGTPTILTGFFTFYQRNENHIKHKEVYFPTALSDDECIELTTI